MVAKVIVSLVGKDRHWIIDLLMLTRAVRWEEKSIDVYFPAILAHADKEGCARVDEWEVVHYPSLDAMDYETSLRKYIESLIAQLREELPIESYAETDFEVKFFTHGFPRVRDFKNAIFSDDKKKCRVEF